MAFTDQSEPTYRQQLNDSTHRGKTDRHANWLFWVNGGWLQKKLDFCVINCFLELHYQIYLCSFWQVGRRMSGGGGICDLGLKVCGYRRSGWVFLFRCQLLRPFPTLSVLLWEVPGSDALQGRAPDYMTNTVMLLHTHFPLAFHTSSHSLAWHLTQAHRVSCECTLVLLPLTQVRTFCLCSLNTFWRVEDLFPQCFFKLKSKTDWFSHIKSKHLSWRPLMFQSSMWSDIRLKLWSGA